MEFMRHSDVRLTNKTYTDASLLPMSEAVEKLARFYGDDTQIDTLKSGADGRATSRAVTTALLRQVEKSLYNKGENHGLTLSVVEGQKVILAERVGIEPTSIRRTDRRRF